MTLTVEAPKRLATKLIRKLQQKPGRQLQDLSHYLRSKSIRMALPEGKSASFDPYAAMINQVTDLAELLQNVKEVSPLVDRWEKAHDDYMPGFPPMSPVTTSFFNTWIFFDVGTPGETLGSICLDLGRAFGMHPERLRVLDCLCQSRMGFFLHEGSLGPRARLREVVSEEVSEAVVPAGYLGEAGELWFARLLPPVRAGLDPVVVTTPYIVLHPDQHEWNSYFERHGGAANYAAHMKQGMAWNYWTEFVFEGYANHTPGSIGLLGLPDVAKTRPHSPEFDAAMLDSRLKTLA